MAYLPPLNGGRINASIAGNTTGSSSASAVSTGTVVFAGGSNVTLSQSTGVNGATISFNGASQSVQTQNLHNLVIGGNTTGTTASISSGTLTLAGGNNITLSQAGGNAISIIGGAGGGGGIVLYDGAHSITSGTASIAVAGALTASITNQTLSLSAPATSSVVGSGIVSLSTNGSSVTISAPAFSAGISSTLGNTAGTTGTVSNQLIFAGGNNITLSQSTTNTGATLTISAANQTNQTVGLYGVGNTTQSSSTTLDARTVSFNGLGGMSVGFSNGSVQLSAQAFSAGVSNLGNSSGNTGMVSNRLVLVGGNNIGLSQSTNASGATVSITGAAGGGGGGVALYDGANSISSGTASISVNGALTASINAQTLSLSVPATSSIVGTNGISISSNGSTISVQPSRATAYVNMMPISTAAQSWGALGVSNGSAWFFPVSVAQPVIFDALRIASSLSFVSSSASGAQSITQSFGLYSMNGSTLSQISSNTIGYSITNSSTSATMSFATSTGTGGYGYGTASTQGTAAIQGSFGTGVGRLIDLQFGNTMTLSAGMYWLGLARSESTANAAIGIGQSIIGNVHLTTPFGLIGSSSNAAITVSSIKMPFHAFGPYGASTNALPGSVSISSIVNSITVIPLMTFIST